MSPSASTYREKKVAGPRLPMALKLPATSMSVLSANQSCRPSGSRVQRMDLGSVSLPTQGPSHLWLNEDNLSPDLLCPQKMTGFSAQGRDSAHRRSFFGGGMGRAGAEERELGGRLEDTGSK